MRVKDLIAALEKLPPDAIVGNRGVDSGTYGSGYTYLSPVGGLEETDLFFESKKDGNTYYHFTSSGLYIY
jgi:hypothetical protein